MSVTPSWRPAIGGLAARHAAGPKDLTAVRGMVTSMGSLVFKDQVTAHDSIIAERMRAAGAIFIGRSNVPEFGLGSHTYNQVYGITRNPYDLTRSAGGSSGGAAAALAARMLPVADGSDFGGSLRNPAGFCNVYGFRPSAGRVPYGPAPEVFLKQLAYEGPMGRSPRDVALMLSVLAGHDRRVPLSLTGDPAQFAQPLDSDLRGKRIGWLGDWGGHLPMEPGCWRCARRRWRICGRWAARSTPIACRSTASVCGASGWRIAT